MGQCTENGLAILTEEEPDDVYVCEKGTDERAGKHTQIAREVMSFFDGL
jgi:hypothetical protein